MQIPSFTLRKTLERKLGQEYSNCWDYLKSTANHLRVSENPGVRAVACLLKIRNKLSRVL
jgi:hypothetical protein